MGPLCLVPKISSLSFSTTFFGFPRCEQLCRGSPRELNDRQGRKRFSLQAQPCRGISTIHTTEWRASRRRTIRCSGPGLEPEPYDPEFPNEEVILYRRTVYDHKDWTRHRSSLRHSRHILSMRTSRVILALWPPVFGLTAVSIALSAYNEGIISHWLPSFLPLLHVSAAPFQLISPALALLLVFRTNASYARFDEARRAWGSNVNRTRDITRQALTWMQHPSDAEKVKKLIRHCVAFNICMKHYLVRDGDLRDDLHCLVDEEIDGILSSTHRPNYVLQVMSEIIHSCSITDMQLARMDNNMTQFADNLGACERIFKTPIPLSYTRLTSRFLVLWHIALPLALWDQCQWISVPATFLSAGALFCIEEVGVLIEEPFQIFPLDYICSTIKKNVDGLVLTHKEIHHCHSHPPKGCETPKKRSSCDPPKPS